MSETSTISTNHANELLLVCLMQITVIYINTDGSELV